MSEMEAARHVRRVFDANLELVASQFKVEVCTADRGVGDESENDETDTIKKKKKKKKKKNETTATQVAHESWCASTIIAR